MLAEGGELAKIGRTPELLGVLEKYGDPACEFVWRNKAALAVGAAAAAFLADPEPFLNGAKDITRIVAEDVVKPVAEVPATVAREAAGDVARNTSWTLVFGLGVVALAGLGAFRVWLRSGRSNLPSSPLSTGGEKPCP